ncbi:hypothetical protein [Micromonospora sp. RTGN7]|uniref:hypothetical protein n=1 Tax=Micromonospora sp. RTGN7 TaxID=3016526 RepID=UPI0029FECA63|nr:hypothetical protein [Micromonospora sp. RTGN7]
MRAGAIAVATTLVFALSDQPRVEAAPVDRVTSSVVGSDGATYTATNHLVRDEASGRPRAPREWLLAWAGDENPVTGGTAGRAAGGHHATAGAAGDPDFLAVIDATKGSPEYGRVVNTVTMSPVVGNEPHHLQYIWHKGQKLYAAGLFSDITYVLDASRLPQIRLVGINLPADTPCGSLPDASWVLRDGTAYVTYMGGPDVAGPCRYSNGEVRNGNGFGGTPGEVVRIGPDGRTLAEAPADFPTGGSPETCKSIPQVQPATCANPHGVQVREDLNLMVVSDFAEARNYLDPSSEVVDPYLLRDTVRIFDISNRNRPRLRSVAHLPEGPRVDQLPAFSEPRMVMETTVTNQRRHKGAFVSTMAGGAIFYTPDITAPNPRWQEIFDDTTAYRAFDTTGLLTGSNSGGSWLQTSLDDRYLFHAVMGSDPRQPRDVNSGMLYVLDIQKLLAAGKDARCRIDTVAEVSAGGVEPDCPALLGVVPLRDAVSPLLGVGPHWGAIDHFGRAPGLGGKLRDQDRIDRVATSNYFLAQSGIDGDHRVCLIDIADDGRPALDNTFRDEYADEPCVSFNRAWWPHGATGNARPHGVLFAVADADLH